jgi:calcium/calmodulin-dependent protein kinase I
LIRTEEVPVIEAAASINWMALQRCQTQGKRGFTLNHGDCREVFLSEDHDEVERWVQALKDHCICTDFPADFDLVGILGQGSSSEVYLASELQTGQQYAVKIIEKAKLTKNTHKQGVFREVDILRRLDHPNIVKLKRVYEDVTRVYLVLEHIKGPSLLARLEQEQRFSEEFALFIMQKVLEVLIYLDSQKVIHRDIKPENIILNEDDNSITLVDFGLAVELTDDTEQTCGSPGYVAPEILCKQGCSTKADVFSAGVLLYLMLSGHMPFASRDKRTLIQRNRMGFVSFPKELWCHVSLDSVNIVLEMMTVDSWERPYASEILKSLLKTPSTRPSSPTYDDLISEPPPFSLDLVDQSKARTPKRIMRTLKEVDDSLTALPRRNSIPKSGNFVIDSLVLRRANSLI